MSFSSDQLPNITAVIPCGGVRNSSSSSSSSTNQPTSTGGISDISYHENGKTLYVVNHQESKLHVIDCLNGKLSHVPYKCESESIHIVEATHHEQCVLFAGNGGNNSTSIQTQPLQHKGRTSNSTVVQYWSLYDNKILRKFRGHTDVVTNISMCPADDTFLTSSMDRTIRLWNLSQAGCIGELKLPTTTTTTISPGFDPPHVTYDSTGLVFTVTASMVNPHNSNQVVGHYVHLYDARNYGAGAFAEMKVTNDDIAKCMVHKRYKNHNNKSTNPIIIMTQKEANAWSQTDWTSVQFNVSGNQIMVGTQKGMCILLDGFDGTIQQVLVDPLSSSSTTSTSTDLLLKNELKTVACFTTDDRYVLRSNNYTSEDQSGTISCWDVNTGEMIHTTLPNNPPHPNPIQHLAMNPKYAQFASCCTNQTALWSW